MNTRDSAVVPPSAPSAHDGAEGFVGKLEALVEAQLRPLGRLRRADWPKTRFVDE